MRLRFAMMSAALLMAASLSSAQAVAQELHMGGTGTATGLLTQLAPAFTAATGIKVVVFPSLGSSGDIRALTANKLDVAVSARPLFPAEVAGGLKQLLTLRAAFVLATAGRPAGNVKSTDIAGFYKNPNARWPDGTPVRIILRPRSDVDTDLLGDDFPGVREAIEVARQRSEVPTAGTDQDNADMAERIKGVLTATTTSQIKTESRKLVVMSIDGVEPTLANIENGTYPYTKELYFIGKTAGSPGVTRFVEFLKSAEGLKLLRDAEVLPGAP